MKRNRKFKVGDMVHFNPKWDGASIRIRYLGPGPYRIISRGNSMFGSCWNLSVPNGQPFTGDNYIESHLVFSELVEAMLDSVEEQECR